MACGLAGPYWGRGRHGGIALISQHPGCCATNYPSVLLRLLVNAEVAPYAEMVRQAFPIASLLVPDADTASAQVPRVRYVIDQCLSLWQLSFGCKPEPLNAPLRAS